MGEAIGGVRAAFMRMLDAHVALLRAELEITGRELGVIAGLAFGALFIAILALILLYVGSFLFFGELLFGSMGWGIIHGTLIAVAFIGFVGINLAGGDVTRYGWGALVGLVVAVVLAAIMLSNVSNEGGESLRSLIVEEFQTESLPFGDEWLVFLTGLLVGALVGLIVGLIVVWRTDLSGSARSQVIALITLVGAIALGILFPTRYDATDGVLGLVIMVGLITWIIAGIVLAARAGFDPEARYADLVPRESIESFKKTKEFMQKEFERQKGRMLGR